MLLLAVVLAAKASAPTAVLLPPLVLASNESLPIPVLLAAVLTNKELYPIAVFEHEEVLHFKALVPTATLSPPVVTLHKAV